jgi:hypothetical protein
MDLNKLSLGDKIAAACGIVLFIDLVAFPWHNIDFIIGSVKRTAIQSPNSFWGFLALLLTIAVVAAIIVRKLTTAKLPDLPIPWSQAIFFASIATLALLLLKLIIETSALGFGAYLGILLAAGMTYGGYLISQEGDTATGNTGVGGMAPPPPPPPGL